MTQDGSDPLHECDPWCVQNSKGRSRPAAPEAKTLAHFMPPGLGALSSIEEKPSGAIALSNEELEKGMDLIQNLLDDRLTDSEKRERAKDMAVAAKVPWLPKPPEAPASARPARKHLNRFSRIAKWCDCSDDECDKSSGASSPGF